MLQWPGPVGRVCARVSALCFSCFFIFLLAFNPAVESVNSGQMVAFHGVKTGCSPGALLSTMGPFEF